MSKHNLLIKKIKKKILAISDFIENSFNKLKYFRSNYKKILLSKDNRVFSGFGIVVFLTLCYFLTPNFYNKDLIQSQIKSQIFKNYNIDLIFNEKISYGLIPKPHFSSKNLSILKDEKEIGVSKDLKIFIETSQFFSVNKVFIKDLVFNKTDFDINLDDLSFFFDLLKTEPNENEIFFKKSNIFFKNTYDEVLFINRIKESKFYYDSINLENSFTSKNEIFNIPYKFIVKNNKFKKQVIFEFNSKKIRLNVENKINYDEKNKKGILDILLINKNTSLNYVIKKNNLNFVSENMNNNYSGKIDFKPFYFKSELNFDVLNLKNLFNNDSIFIDLIKSNLFNNKNLSANVNINTKNISSLDEINQLFLKLVLDEGNINLSGSNVMWKNSLKMSLNECYIFNDDSGTNLIGRVTIDFMNLSDFYKSFQVTKNSRKDIQKIELDFIYNLDQKKVKLDNVKIDTIPNEKLEKYVDNFNDNENLIINKIIFKNFINDFFRTYAG